MPPDAESYTTRVLVLDGEERVALAVVRSLVRAGYEVWVTARHRWAIAAVSKGARLGLVRSHPRTEPGKYQEEIAALVNRIQPRLIMPLTDASAEVVLERRSCFPLSAVIPFADRAVYRAASDKIHVHDLASEVGLGIEESEIVHRKGDSAPSRAELYPGVVKPHRSVFGGLVRQHAKVRVVSDRAACAAALQALPEDAFPVLVQRRVRGPGEGFFAARWGGVTLARFAHRRLREKPPSGGVSVFRESIPLDPEFAEACDRLLDRLHWQGVAMVECKRDLDRGGWRLMEINGRFWGSLQLAVDAGVDFPAILANAVLGRPVGPPPVWRTGTRLRWEWGDIDHLLMRLLYSRRALSLPEGAPGRLGALADFLANKRGRDSNEVFRLNDPMPFLAETATRFGLRF